MPMPKELFAKREQPEDGSESFFLADDNFRNLAENGASVLVGRYELVETFELRLEPKLHPVANK